MEDLVSPFFLSLLFSLLILFYFLFIQGPIGDLKCLSCIAHGAEECHPHPRLPIRPSTTARSRLLGTIDGSLSCVECDKAHVSHCSHMKPADVSLFYVESLRAPSFASTQHEPSCKGTPNTLLRSPFQSSGATRKPIQYYYVILGLTPIIPRALRCHLAPFPCSDPGYQCRDTKAL